MKILILNGNDDAGKSWFDEYIFRLVETLRESGHTVTHLLLRDLQINYCNGCFKPYPEPFIGRNGKRRP